MVVKVLLHIKDTKRSFLYAEASENFHDDDHESGSVTYSLICHQLLESWASLVWTVALQTSMLQLLNIDQLCPTTPTSDLRIYVPTYLSSLVIPLRTASCLFDFI